MLRPPARLWSQIIKTLAWALIAGIIYYLTAYLGLKLATLNPQASPVWPATGVAICLYYLFGAPAALGVFWGAFFANFQTGLSIFPCLLIGLGNSAEVLVCFWIFRFLMRFKNDYGVHGKVIFGVVAAIVATALSASIGTLALYFHGVVTSILILKNWLTWWMGDIIGALFFIPFAYGISIQKWKLFHSFRKEINIAALLFIFSVILINWIFFNGQGAAFVFIIYLVLLFAARFLTSIWIFGFTLLICISGTYATFLGLGPFAETILNENMLHLQLFLLGLGLTGLVLSSLSEEGLRHRPAMILIFGWFISGLTFYSFFKSNSEADHLRFTEEAKKAQQAIEVTLNDYFGLLDSGVGFLNSNDYVSKQAWRSYVTQIMKDKKFIGVRSIGIAFASKTGQLQDLAKENHLKHADIENLVVHPVPYVGNSLPNLQPEMHFIVTYVVTSEAPFLNEKIVIGLDYSTEQSRYKTALRARDTGDITSTDNIRLSSDVKPRSAFLIFAPFYKSGAPIDTVAQRRAAFRGVVFTPIIVEPFVTAALGHHAEEMHLELEFKSPTGTLTPMYLSASKVVDVKNEIVYDTMLAGQAVRIHWRKTENFKSSSDLTFSLIAFFGSVISLLVAIILSSLQNLTLTAQKIAGVKTRELIEKNKNWQLLTETAPVGIFLTDRLGHFTYVNSSLSQMTGTSASELLGYEWMHSVHKDDLPMVQQNWHGLQQGKELNCNYRILNSEQSTIFVWGQVVAMRNDTNHVIGYLGVIQDMTDSVQKNNSLIATSRMSSLGEMASGVAHEINNPLSIIIGKADMLRLMLEKDNFDANKIKKYSQQISETASRIAKIIRGLRAFARETSNEPFEVCRLSSVVQETFELCQERFLSHHIELRPPLIDQYENLQCWGRPEQLAQVLLNLLNNAFDAALTSNEKWVEVHVQAVNSIIKIAVIDSGAGIPQPSIKKIFEPFYTTKEVGKGTGLGLSISKGIMEKHQGLLYFDVEAKHTTFIVEISEYVAHYQIEAKDP